MEAIAYRLLGSAGDAEDAVQDTFLRWQSADREQIRTAEAWLTKALTNVCLNRLGSARARREAYVGPWLPEPVLDGDRMLGPAETVEQRQTVSLALLALMERLSPAERSVYVLREAFGYSHREIAELLDLTEANSQQLYRRARLRVGDGRARTEVDPAVAQRVAEEFLAAAIGGDIEPLIKLLAEDAVSLADNGGGPIPARRSPVVGSVAIAQYLTRGLKPTAGKRALAESVAGGDVALVTAAVNQSPAVLAIAENRVIAVIALELAEDRVSSLQVQVNPDKLAHITRQWRTTEHPEQPGITW